MEECVVKSCEYQTSWNALNQTWLPSDESDGHGSPDADRRKWETGKLYIIDKIFKLWNTKLLTNFKKTPP